MNETIVIVTNERLYTLKFEWNQWLSALTLVFIFPIKWPFLWLSKRMLFPRPTLHHWRSLTGCIRFVREKNLENSTQPRSKSCAGSIWICERQHIAARLNYHSLSIRLRVCLCKRCNDFIITLIVRNGIPNTIYDTCNNMLTDVSDTYTQNIHFIHLSCCRCWIHMVKRALSLSLSLSASHTTHTHTYSIHTSTLLQCSINNKISTHIHPAPRNVPCMHRHVCNTNIKWTITMNSLPYAVCCDGCVCAQEFTFFCRCRHQKQWQPTNDEDYDDSSSRGSRSSNSNISKSVTRTQEPTKQSQHG